VVDAAARGTEGVMKQTVRDNPARQRYELAAGDALAIIDYRREAASWP